VLLVHIHACLTILIVACAGGDRQRQKTNDKASSAGNKSRYVDIYEAKYIETQNMRDMETDMQRERDKNTREKQRQMRWNNATKYYKY
jgi:hypothetical protein